MPKIIKSALLSAILMPLTVHAGIAGLTWHSRANCVNNESITWELGKEAFYMTISSHRLSKFPYTYHQEMTNMEETWRSAAVHWGEANPGDGWQVQGEHRVMRAGHIILLGITDVDDCSIYDGWWDQVKTHVKSKYKNTKIKNEWLPTADSGVHIVPLSKLNAINPEINKRLFTAKYAMQQKGYDAIDNPNAKVLFNKKYSEVLHASTNVTDTHLKASIDDVGLAFTPKALSIAKENIVGYAASGSYDHGWSGMTVVFNDKLAGVCQYTVNNLSLTHGAEWIADEIVRHDINGKITTVDVAGNDHTGYVYTVHWADAKTLNDLECANLSFSKAKTTAVINIAKAIDSK